MSYAKGTEVTVERSRAEIERTLQRYGAEQFAYGWDAQTVIIGFRMRDRQVRFRVAMPDRQSRDIRLTAQGRTRTASAQQDAYDQMVRQRWRALLLVIKGKLESVELGIESFEQAFLANIMLPSGETVGEWVEPQIEATYRTRQMPALLPGLGDDDEGIVALPSGSSR